MRKVVRWLIIILVSAGVIRLDTLLLVRLTPLPPAEAMHYARKTLSEAAEGKS